MSARDGVTATMRIQDQITPTRPATRVDGTGRWPATAVFFLNGLAQSTYIVRLPSLKSDYHLTAGRLGLVGVLFGLAALASMQFVGPLIARVGTRPVLRASLVVLPLLLALLGLVGGPVGFALVAAALGAVHGAPDAATDATPPGASARASPPSPRPPCPAPAARPPRTSSLPRPCSSPVGSWSGRC